MFFVFLFISYMHQLHCCICMLHNTTSLYAPMNNNLVFNIHIAVSLIIHDGVLTSDICLLFA